MNNNDNQIEFKYRGDNADPLKNNKSTIRAKITDWYCSNEIISDNGGSSNSESESEEKEKPQYKLRFVVGLSKTSFETIIL